MPAPMYGRLPTLEQHTPSSSTGPTRRSGLCGLRCAAAVPRRPTQGLTGLHWLNAVAQVH
jgi:hypothetical protein